MASKQLINIHINATQVYLEDLDKIIEKLSTELKETKQAKKEAVEALRDLREELRNRDEHTNVLQATREEAHTNGHSPSSTVKDIVDETLRKEELRLHIGKGEVKSKKGRIIGSKNFGKDNYNEVFEHLSKVQSDPELKIGQFTVKKVSEYTGMHPNAVRQEMVRNELVTKIGVVTRKSKYGTPYTTGVYEYTGATIAS